MIKEKFLDEEEIIHHFINYIDSSIYNYAIMLDGSWGSGKTFFIKEKLIPEVNKHEEEKKKHNAEYKIRKVLYVSLYGITDTEQISRLLYIELRNLMVQPKKRSLKRTTQGIRSWIGTGAKILSDVIKDTKGIDAEAIFNQVSSGFSLEQCIFIFDDLERTSCNINDVLGYINNFVEHDGIKVLLVANEAEINKASKLDINPDELMVCLQNNLDFSIYEENDKHNSKGDDKISLSKLKDRVNILFKKNLVYKQIKEKVVGETIIYQPMYNNMINSLANKHIQNQSLKEIVLSKNKSISEIADRYGHLNLRTYLFFLSKIVKIGECLKDSLGVLSNIIEYTFLVCLKSKKGLEIEEWEDGVLVQMKHLYGIFDYKNSCLAFKFIDDYILYGKFNNEEIISIIEQYKEEEKKKQEEADDPACKIANWLIMEDEEVISCMNQVLCNMKKNDYSFEQYPRILNSFVSLISIGFNNKLLDDLINSMKDNINKCKEKVNLNSWYTSFVGDKDRVLYNQKMEELKRQINEKQETNCIEKLTSMLSDLDNWGKNIGEYVSETNKLSLKERQFINKLNIDIILELIDKSNTYNIEEFRYAIGCFYDFSNISDYYMDDYSNLMKLYNGLEPDKYNLIKRQSVVWLKDLLEQKIKLLEPK